MAKRPPSAHRATPCFEITLNGKRLAIAGIRSGEGNLNAHLTWSRTNHYGEGWASRGGIRLHVGGGDFNDSKWDRFVIWVNRQVRVGDRVEIRVVEGVAPDRAMERTRARRIPIDEWPSPRNPTAVELPGISLYALTDDVWLRVGKRTRGAVHLSPEDATKVGRGLIKAARAIETRQKRSLHRPRRRGA